MGAIAYTPPSNMKQQIRDMAAKASIFFPGAAASTVKSLAYQVKIEFNKRQKFRKYRTARVDGGVQVWRDK